MADLIINGFDAFLQWGIRMGDGFLRPGTFEGIYRE